MYWGYICTCIYDESWCLLAPRSICNSTPLLNARDGDGCVRPKNKLTCNSEPATKSPASTLRFILIHIQQPSAPSQRALGALDLDALVALVATFTRVARVVRVALAVDPQPLMVWDGHVGVPSSC